MPCVNRDPTLSARVRMRNAGCTKFRRHLRILRTTIESGPAASMHLAQWRKSGQHAAFQCLFVAFGVIG
jgi:hypothetical protein